MWLGFSLGRAAQRLFQQSGPRSRTRFCVGVTASLSIGGLPVQNVVGLKTRVCLGFDSTPVQPAGRQRRWRKTQSKVNKLALVCTASLSVWLPPARMVSIAGTVSFCRHVTAAGEQHGSQFLVHAMRCAHTSCQVSYHHDAVTGASQICTRACLCQASFGLGEGCVRVMVKVQSHHTVHRLLLIGLTCHLPQ